MNSPCCRSPDTVKCPLEVPIFRFPSGYVYLRTGVATGLGFRTYIYVQKYERVNDSNPGCCARSGFLCLVIIIGMCIAGEFTPDNQQRVKHEEDKEHTRLDKWKARLSYYQYALLPITAMYTLRGKSSDNLYNNLP